MNQDPATPRPTPARVQLEGRLVLKFDTLLSPDNPDHQAFANDLPNVILNEAENRKLWDVEGEGIEGEFAFNLKATVARNPEHPPENYGELYVDFAVTATLDEIPEDDGPLSAAYGKGWAASLLMVIGEELNANPGALLGQDRETEDGASCLKAIRTTIKATRSSMR